LFVSEGRSLEAIGKEEEGNEKKSMNKIIGTKTKGEGGVVSSQEIV